MIGLLAKLTKAAQLAKQAEAAIDVASNRLAPGERPPETPETPETPSAPPADGEAPAPVDSAPSEYLAVIEAGAKDARKLLTAEDARSIIGKRIRSRVLTGHEEFLACDYGCKDRAGTTLGLHVSATVTWESFDNEIPKKEIFEGVGDAAFRGDRQIYVKSGNTVFWIHTAGEVTVAMALEAARLVVQRLAD